MHCVEEISTQHETVTDVSSENEKAIPKRILRNHSGKRQHMSMLYEDPNSTSKKDERSCYLDSLLHMIHFADKLAIRQLRGKLYLDDLPKVSLQSPARSH